jgi:hypothetical protein
LMDYHLTRMQCESWAMKANDIKEISLWPWPFNY